jgi:NADH-quinone oxidoreductase subunit L
MTSDTLIQFALYILFLPLLGFLVLIFFGKRLPRHGDWLGTGILGVTLVLSFIILFVKLLSYPAETFIGEFTWIDLGNVPFFGPISVELGIMLDNLSVIMLVVVALVSFLVHLFSIGYMQGDVRYSRYFAYLGIFSFSMYGIVVTHNFLMMYIFWELVGLSSYLLIGHWYEKKSASNAAMKAFIVNRIGDAGMFIGIMILFVTFSTFTFEKIFDSLAIGMIPFGSEAWLTAAGILIFCGAIGKSAQFPLHVWLPDAMEGPTPVSALIHAATMVAAGVFLIARTFAIMTGDALMVITYIGVITALIGAIIAITQFDIKKVLAYSTISQLGYMVMALGTGAFTAGFFHLVTHASFKAGLFLGSGSVIHAMHRALHKKHDHHTDPQDIRNMGGLKKKMPITYITFLLFTLAISGVPFTSGFLSKDEILAGTLGFANVTGHYLVPVLAFLVAGMTAFYMFRLLILTFHGEHADPSRETYLHESPSVMTIPLIIFASLSIWIFYSFNPFGAASGWFYSAVERPLSVVPATVQPVAADIFKEAVHQVHTIAMILSILIAGLGILFAFAVYQYRKINADNLSKAAGPLYSLSYNKLYFDEMYDKSVIRGTLGLAKISAWFDNTIIDGIVNGSATLTRLWSNFSGRFDNVVIDGFVNFSAYFTGFIGLLLRKFQTGKVQTYLVFVIFSIIIFFFIFRSL